MRCYSRISAIDHQCFFFPGLLIPPKVLRKHFIYASLCKKSHLLPQKTNIPSQFQNPRIKNVDHASIDGAVQN